MYKNNDVISRQAAIDAIRNIRAITGTHDDEILLIDKAEAQTKLMLLSSVEPQIIHCKDCRYWKLDDDDCETGYCRDIYGIIGDIYGNGFCSDAEKRQDENMTRKRGI